MHIYPYEDLFCLYLDSYEVLAERETAGQKEEICRVKFLMTKFCFICYHSHICLVQVNSQNIHQQLWHETNWAMAMLGWYL